MPDRRRVLDAVCGTCKRVIRRLEEPAQDDVIQLKSEIMADALIPFDYETDKPLVPIKAHADGCAKRPH